MIEIKPNLIDQRVRAGDAYQAWSNQLLDQLLVLALLPHGGSYKFACVVLEDFGDICAFRQLV